MTDLRELEKEIVKKSVNIKQKSSTKSISRHNKNVVNHRHKQNTNIIKLPNHISAMHLGTLNFPILNKS